MNSLQNIMEQLESINKKQSDFDKRHDNAEKTLREIKGPLTLVLKIARRLLRSVR